MMIEWDIDALVQKQRLQHSTPEHAKGPTMEALAAARTALDANLADTTRDIERVVALALDAFAEKRVEKERERCASWVKTQVAEDSPLVFNIESGEEF
jgi:hypothetical protein